MPSALKKITTRAKQIFKKGGSWKSAIKEASREYRAGKPARKSVGSNKGRYRQTGKSNRKRDEERKARPPGARIPRGGKKVTYYERRKNRSDKPGQLTGASVGTLKNEIKKRITNEIDSLVIRKFHSVKKRLKNKLQKSIIKKKAALRKLLF